MSSSAALELAIRTIIRLANPATKNATAMMMIAYSTFMELATSHVHPAEACSTASLSMPETLHTCCLRYGILPNVNN
ncbi:MAG: hypothetical protein KDJ69_15860, partial [Nitratireductor sp.]|nr:hypothetical protein [Nitratireductor sp.]